jgi:precorrin-6A synthase
VLVIGIGVGDPAHLTVQAVRALGRVDVFFILDKGKDTRDLVALRRQLLGEHARPPYRVVPVADPLRDRQAAQYPAAVAAWRGRRVDLWERLLREELGDGECAAFLVWGDPGLFDGTLSILQEVLARGIVEFDYEVIPGISAVAALAARHRVVLNQVGGAVQITTGRRLTQGWPSGVDDVVVMLDADGAFTRLDDQDDLDIFWGAFVGTPDELLVCGRLSQVAAHIQELREQARRRKGWIMDTYLLRRIARRQDGG